MSRFIARVFRPLIEWERRECVRSLREYGLMVEDTYTLTPQVQVAVAMLPEDVRVARERRIRRAVDLTLKKKQLPEEMQNYDPLDKYLEPYLQILENREKDHHELFSF